MMNEKTIMSDLSTLHYCLSWSYVFSLWIDWQVSFDVSVPKIVQCLTLSTKVQDLQLHAWTKKQPFTCAICHTSSDFFIDKTGKRAIKWKCDSVHILSFIEER